ncbi:MAG: GIN domain-containing protein [Luteibaculaceae bacterium]
MEKLPLKLLFSFVLFSLSFSTLYGQYTQVRKLRAFNGIKVFGAVEVNVIPSAEPKAVISSEIGLDRISTTFVDDVLYIRIKKSFFKPGGKVLINLYATPINALYLQGKADVKSKDTLLVINDSLRVTAEYRSQVNLMLNLNKVYVESVQRSTVVLTGQSDYCALYSASSTKLNAAQFECNTGSAMVKTFSSADLNFKEKLKARAVLGSSIRLVNTPETLKKASRMGSSVKIISQ